MVLTVAGVGWGLSYSNSSNCTLLCTIDTDTVAKFEQLVSEVNDGNLAGEILKALANLIVSSLWFTMF